MTDTAFLIVLGALAILLIGLIGIVEITDRKRTEIEMDKYRNYKNKKN